MRSSADAALEQRLERVAEVLLHGGERLEEQLARGGVDLLDRLEQLVARRPRSPRCGLEEVVALLLLRVLLEREQVDRAQAAELLAQLVEPRAGRLGVERPAAPGLVPRRGLVGGELDVVLDAQALERAVQLGAGVEPVHLERVHQLGQRVRLVAQRAQLLLLGLHQLALAQRAGARLLGGATGLGLALDQARRATTRRATRPSEVSIWRSFALVALDLAPGAASRPVSRAVTSQRASSWRSEPRRLVPSIHAVRASLAARARRLAARLELGQAALERRGLAALLAALARSISSSAASSVTSSSVTCASSCATATVLGQARLALALGLRALAGQRLDATARRPAPRRAGARSATRARASRPASASRSRRPARARLDRGGDRLVELGALGDESR